MNNLPGLRPKQEVGPASIRELVNEEYDHRKLHNELGQLDMWLTIASMPVIAINEVTQTELQKEPYLASGHDLMLRMAEAPWDWKAIAVSAGGFALSNAAARINHYSKLNSELVELSQHFNEGAQILPYTHRQYRRNRFLHRAKRGLLTAAVCAAGYKLGEHGTLDQDMIGGSALVGIGWISAGVTKIRYGRKLDRLLSSRQNEDTSARPPHRRALP